MNVSWITARDLEYLIAVSDHLHFGRAAASCRVTQPALSSQIKKIEHLLGVTVFERTQRKVALTHGGREIVEQARIALEELKKIGEIAGGDKTPLSGVFQIGSIATLGPYLIPHLLGPLREKFPRGRFLLREGQTEGLLESLKRGELDVVLMATDPDDASIGAYPLFFEPFFVVAPKGHRISSLNPLTPQDLNADEMVLLEDAHCLKDQAIELCTARRKLKKAPQEFQATGLETLRHLVGAGVGYTLFPALAVGEAAEKLDDLVKYRRFQSEKVGREVVLAYRKRTTRMKDVEALAQFIRAHLPKGVRRV